MKYNTRPGVVTGKGMSLTTGWYPVRENKEDSTEVRIVPTTDKPNAAGMLSSTVPTRTRFHGTATRQGILTNET